MRIWHYKLIGVLPKSQLIAQWRELNSIFAKQDKHILINYVYDYPKAYLYSYSWRVLNELLDRGFNIRSLEKYNAYFADEDSVQEELTFPEHDTEYLTVCYWNLREKWRRGQKDITDEVWQGIEKVYKGEWL